VVADLAIEFLSPGNTPTEMAIKLKEYFRAGVRPVWYIDLQCRRATVYRSLKDFTEIDESGTLDGGKVLPGFRIKLKTLFARAPRE
jgi:Uma2 family endonuclease